LLNAVGYQTELKHGEILYKPEGYWHYMRYLTPTFSMSLRGLPNNPLHFAQAIYNIMNMRNVDNLMRKLAGKNWISWKNEKALFRTNQNLRSINPNVHS
jgi:ribosomal protein L16 Arg81 hydroxylase